MSKLKKKKINPKLKTKVATAQDLQRFLDSIPSMLGYWNSSLVNEISNSAYAGYFGKNPSEIRGRQIKDLLGPEIYKANQPYIRKALAGKAQTFERTIPAPDGRLRETVANYIPDIVGRKVLGFFVIVTEITEIKQLERKNREIEAKLFSLSKMSSLGEMASGIAHEINNPLSVIYGSACQISKLIEKKNFDIEKVKSLAKEIEETSRRIENIVDGLRTFSGDPIQQKFENVSAVSIVRNTLALCEAKFRKFHIDISLENFDESLFLDCRPVQISQILLNILNNAFDAIAKSSSGTILIQLEDEGRFLSFIVSNTGAPIPRKIADKIFEPFFTTKEVGKGTGLGLSISKGIAKSHRGSLKLDLDAKETKFILRLPKKQKIKPKLRG